MKKQKKIKEKKSKKQLPREVGSSLFTLIVILITLGSTLPLHFIFPEALTTYWVIAICVAIISPFAITNAMINFEEKGNFTDEQKKVAKAKFGMAILLVWYVDFAFVCMFMNWLVAFFILAGIFLIKMIYNVTSVIVSRKNSKVYPNFLIVVYFVLSFLLLILLIYKIPNESLQTIVTALAAALIGGLLTLLGVMLTIKKSNNDIRLENKMKNRPILIMVESHSIDVTSCDLQKSGNIKEDKARKANLGFIMKNIAPMPCKIYGAEYLGRIVECKDKHLWVETQEKVWIHIQFNDFRYDGTIKLLLEDISGNRYEYLLTYDSIGDITAIKDVTEMEAN